MENQETKNLSLIQKIGYGVGDAGSNFCWTFIASFIMIYCTNTLGVSALVIGTLMMFSKILDGITDIFMGRIIDVTRSKMGKARFWYFVSSFPTAFFTFVIFNIPGNFSENTKYVYFFVVYTLIGAVFYTMNNIAYSTLSALCTKSVKDRIEMGCYRPIFAIGAVLVMSYITMGLVENFGGGQDGWKAVSIIYSIVCLVLLLVPFFLLKELPEEELKSTNMNEAKKELGFIQSLSYLLKNKYFLLILMVYLVSYTTAGVSGSMGVYFATYQLGDASLLGMVQMAGMLPQLLFLPVVSRVAPKWGLRKSALAGGIVGIVGAVLIVMGTLWVNFTPVMVGLGLKAIANAFFIGVLTALIAEADEFSSLKFGYRMTGTMFSCSSVGIKVGTGIGTALCGFLLDWGGFDGTAPVQTTTAISTINWSFIVSHVIAPLILIVLFYFMDVEKANERLRNK